MGVGVSNPGQAVIELARSANEHLWVIAPFIKNTALERILDEVPGGVRVSVVCRWHLLEIHGGVCDLEIWPTLRDSGHLLGLIPKLHAKIFATENLLLVGSANVTNTALGWTSAPNEEVIVRPIAEDNLEVREYLDELMLRSTPVDDKIHQRFVELLESLPPSVEPGVPELAQTEGHASSRHGWIPLSRDPQDVERFYAGKMRMLTKDSLESARIDLEAIDVPPGLDPQFLKAHIDSQLLQNSLVRKLQEYLSAPRRFGEISDFVSRSTGMNQGDADMAWQTLSRWLIFFQPDDWGYTKPNYSEIMVFRG